MPSRSNNRVAKIACGIAVLLSVSLTATSQNPQTRDGSKADAKARGSVPDFSATWGVARTPRNGYANPGYSITDTEPEMTPWADEQYKKIREGTTPKDPVRLKRVGKWDRGRENLDPSEIHCLPWGPTRLFTFDHPLEIVQTPGVVYLLFEGDHAVRRVYMDGRPHGGMYDTFMGHSIGRYEGNTLVVDTVAVRDLTWLDTVGHVHSNELHIVERFSRPDPETLQIDFTFEDPKAYPKPWTGRRVFEHVTGTRAEILEYITCQDHLDFDHVPRLLKGLPELVERAEPR